MPFLRRVTTIRLFLASPGDVKAERDILDGVVNEVNQTLDALGHTTEIRVLRWERDSVPDSGRPQGVINRQIPPYDIFVGIMWTRFGSPTGEAGSGTEEEFNLARQRWEHKGEPHILFYFSTAPAVPPQTASDLRQLRNVIKFRSSLAAKQLVATYDGPSKFADVVRRHLFRVVAKIARKRVTGRKRATPQRVGIAGERIRITDVSPDDSYYRRRDAVIGQEGVIRESESTGDGWSGGIVDLDDGTELRLFRFKWERAG